MRRALIGAVLGLVAGAGFGTMLAFVIHLNQPAPPRETVIDVKNRPTKWNTLNDTIWIEQIYIEPQPRETLHVLQSNEGSLSTRLFFGLLLGGGFGAVVGVVTGATGAIVRTMRETASLYPPLS